MHFDIRLRDGGVLLKEYLLAVIGITLLSAFLLNVLPQGKTNKTVKGVVRAACLLVVITPILALFQGFIKKEDSGNFFEDFFSKSVIQTDSNYIDYCREKTVEDAEKSLERQIEKKFSVFLSVELKCRVEQASFSSAKGEWLVVEKAILTPKSSVEQALKEEIAAYILTEYAAKTEWIC